MSKLYNLDKWFCPIESNYYIVSSSSLYGINRNQIEKHDPNMYKGYSYVIDIKLLGSHFSDEKRGYFPYKSGIYGAKIEILTLRAHKIRVKPDGAKRRNTCRIFRRSFRNNQLFVNKVILKIWLLCDSFALQLNNDQLFM